MHPAYPDIVGEWAAKTIDEKSRVWIVTRGDDGKLEDCLDPDALANSLAIAAGLREIAETRAW
jgi:hypothetical protein